MTIPLGGSKIDGNMGVNPNLSVETVNSGKFIYSFDSNLNKTEYLTSDIDEGSGVLLAGGNFANPIKTTSNRSIIPLTLSQAVSRSDAITDETIVMIIDRDNGLFKYKEGQTDNGLDIVSVTGNPLQSLVLEYGSYGINIKQVGAKGDNVNDDTAAINRAQEIAYTLNNMHVVWPVGRYIATGEILVKQGVKQVGDPSQGATEQYGTSLMVNHNGNGIHFAGTGADFSGTGGGVVHFKVIKGNSFTGGQAIIVDGSDINKRHGEMQFEDVFITGSGTGEFQRGLYIDGTAYTTAGSKGVRSINIQKFRVAKCSQANEYILLDQVTHCTSTHLQVDQGGGSGAPGLTLQGDSDNALFSNAIINGEFKVGASTAGLNGFQFSGHCSTFNNTEASVDGIVTAQIASTITNASSALNIVSSDECFIKELTLNKPGGSDDELLTISNAGTKQGAFGTVGSGIVSLKPLVNSGETHIFGTDGGGVERGVQVQFARFRPNTDNLMDLGNAATRWKEVFAGTGTINTSDERHKTELLDIDDTERLVAQDLKKLLKKYKFKDSVQEKGDSARIHFGIGAQTIVDTFSKHGLDASRYGMLCYDKWEDEIINHDDVLDEDGSILEKGYKEVVVKAGDRYGVRYDELLAFIICAM